MTLSEGTILKERYRIKKKIGEGGYGCIYLADDLLKKREYAVKEMLDCSGEDLNTKETREQFRFEAEILVDLEHPQLPKVEDYFEHDGKYYFVTEYIGGNNLAEIVEKNISYLSQDQVIEWAYQLCDILDYLHNHKPHPVIFRDLKPENVMLSEKGKIMLIDFGISKILADTTKTTAAAQSVTPHFAPPEQYGVEGTDTLSDIYSLGATLYFLITKTVPKDSITRFTSKDKDFLKPSSLNQAITGGFENIILKAMALNKEDRYQSVKEIKKELDLISKGEFVTKPVKEKIEGLEELRKSSEKFRLMAENANDIIVTLNNEGLITYATKKIEKLIGFTPEAITGKHFVNFFPPESAVKAIQYFRAPMEGDPRLEQPPLRLSAFTKDGRKVEIEVSTSRIFDGDKILSRICVIRDITIRIKEEEKLNQKLNEFVLLNKCIFVATGGEFIEQKLRNITEILKEIIQFDSARIVLMEKSGENFQVLPIYPEVAHRLGEGDNIPIKNTVIEKVMLNRKPVILSNPKEEIERKILSPGTRSAALFPMILVNSFTGVVIVESQEYYKYVDYYPEVLNSIAQITGMMIRIHRKLEWGLIS